MNSGLFSRARWCAVGAIVMAVSFEAPGMPLAEDDFSSYSIGPGALLGQSVGGSGFVGAWHSVGSEIPLTSNLDVFVDGSVGSIGAAYNSSAGNAADFLSSIQLMGGQLFVRIDQTNLNLAAQVSTRLDLNFGSEQTGNRAFVGAYVTDTLKLALEPNLYSGASQVVADTGITSASAGGSHALVAFFDVEHAQVGLWIDPDSWDYFDVVSGASSADAVAEWTLPSGGLQNLTSYSLIRNRLDAVKFDNFVLSQNPQDVGIAAVPEAEVWYLMIVGLAILKFAGKSRCSKHEA